MTTYAQAAQAIADTFLPRLPVNGEHASALAHYAECARENTSPWVAWGPNVDAQWDSARRACTSVFEGTMRLHNSQTTDEWRQNSLRVITEINTVVSPYSLTYEAGGLRRP